MSDDIEEQELKYSIQYEGDEKAYEYVVKDGKATATFPNKDTFKGEYKDGKRNGPGVYTFATGGTYEGDYKDNMRHGAGVLTAPDGGQYEGEWQNDKRHGLGSYEYPNGDCFEGQWQNDLKHGKGTYHFATHDYKLVGTWVAGKLKEGKWMCPDGTTYIGAFEENKIKGEGMMLFPNGNTDSGVADGHWLSQRHQRPAPFVAAPIPKQADAYTQAVRAVKRAQLVDDHFQGLAQLEELHAGVPNLRKVDGLPLFGSAQPTAQGLEKMLAALTEKEGYSKYTWVSLRREPVLYANEKVHAPRAATNLNKKLEFPGVTSKMVEELEELLAARVALASKVNNAIAFHSQSSENGVPAFAAQSEQVSGEGAIRSLAAVFTQLKEQKEIDLTLHRVPLEDEAPPAVEALDRIVTIVKENAEDSSALLFNCHTGADRTTTAMVAASLVLRALKPAAEEEEEEEKKEDGDAESPAEEAAAEEEAEAEKPAEEAEEKEETQDDEAKEENVEQADGADAAPADDKEAAEPAAAAAAAPVAEVKPKPDAPAEPLPDYELAEFEAVRQLVKLIKKGKKVKQQLDLAIDLAHHVVHLRKSILAAKQAFEQAADATAQQKAKDLGQARVLRYAYLLAFNAYLKEAAPEFEQTFEQWLQAHADIAAVLTPKAQFEWL